LEWVKLHRSPLQAPVVGASSPLSPGHGPPALLPVSASPQNRQRQHRIESKELLTKPVDLWWQQSLQHAQVHGQRWRAGPAVSAARHDAESEVEGRAGRTATSPYQPSAFGKGHHATSSSADNGQSKYAMSSFARLACQMPSRRCRPCRQRARALPPSTLTASSSVRAARITRRATSAASVPEVGPH